jgi:molybdate transport system substrate-binding protein
MVLPLVLLAASLAQVASVEPLTVSAAVSLTEVMNEIAAAYRAAGGAPIRFNFGGSNVLARQIVNGAPVDVFISADDLQMDVVSRAGLVATGTRVPIAGNRLVVVVDERRLPTVRSVQDLSHADIRRVALGDPAAVPAGVYARTYLEKIGLWSRLEAKVVPAGNVRAALAAVQNGSADAAIVYATDARIAGGLRVAVTVSGPDSPPMVYPACVVKTTRQPAAAAHFLQFVRSPVGARILEHHGFVSVPGRP